MFGCGAAGDVVRVRQGPPLHLGQHTLLVQQRLEEPRVAVELHQVEDLKGRKGRKGVISGQGMNKHAKKGGQDEGKTRKERGED